MKYLRPDLIAVRGWFGCVHLLVETDALVLIDTGFIGDFRRIQKAIAALGRKPADLKAILLTHGHLDHTSNASRLQQWCGAKLYAPVGDEQHVQGQYLYCGVARLCGWLESVGRCLVSYQSPHVDHWLRDYDELPFWGGLRVVSLPGHTPGHSGYYAAAKRVLLAGDLFALSWRVALPPSIFNTDTPQATRSFLTAASLDVDLMVPTHYLRLDGSVVRRVRDKGEILMTTR